MADVLDIAAEKMDKTISMFKQDMITLRAGRANPHIVDKVLVDYYGVPTPINQIGNIAVTDPKTLTISLWEVNMIREVEKAIQKSEIGINPSNDGKVIRLNFPDLTEDRRKELVKQVKKRAEEAKVAIRAVRRDVIETLKKQEKNKEITEDDLKDDEKEIQKSTDEHIKQIDTIASDKEKEIMEV
jgi:ribosome recycling factor